MTLEEIVEVLNNNIELSRTAQQLDTNLGHLVLQKTVDVNPTFKSYKKFSLILWFVKNKNNSKVFSVEKQTSYSTYDKDIKELENLTATKRNVRLLLKQNPKTFGTQSVDFFNY